MKRASGPAAREHGHQMGGIKMKVLRIAVVIWFMGFHVIPVGAEEPTKQSSKERPQSILTLKEVLARVEQGHPLLRGSQTQKIVASGKLLKALALYQWAIGQWVNGSSPS